MTWRSYRVKLPPINGRTEPGTGEELPGRILHSGKVKTVRKHTLSAPTKDGSGQARHCTYRYRIHLYSIYLFQGWGQTHGTAHHHSTDPGKIQHISINQCNASHKWTRRGIM